MRALGDALLRNSKGVFSTFTRRNDRQTSEYLDLEDPESSTYDLGIPLLPKTRSTWHEWTMPGGKDVDDTPPSVHQVTRDDFLASQRLSASNRLSRQVLQQIFHEAVQPDLDIVPTHFPALSRVCRLWRTVALYTPLIWSGIYVDLRRKSTLSSSYLTLLGIVLKRSQDAPLRIYIINVKPHNKWSEGHPALNLLLSHSNRWRIATIQTVPSGILAFQTLRKRLLSLESLELIASEDTKGYNGVMHDMFEVAPRLRTLRVLGDWSKAPLVLPWIQLTCYEDDHGIVAAVGLVRQSHRISDSGDARLSSHPTRTAPTVLVELQKLHITFGCPAYRGFFDHVLMPNLKDLKVVNYTAGSFSIIGAMVARSSPEVPCLHSFTCHMDFLKPAELSTFLRHTPRLEYLDITLPPVEDLREMHIHPFSNPIVPNLQTLRVRATTTVREHAAALHSLAQNRCEWVDSARPASTSDSKKYSRVRRMKNFAIEFKDAQVHFMERQFLDSPSDRVDALVRMYLRPCKNHIMELLPWIFEETVGKKRSLIAKQLRALDKTFKVIEGIVVKDGRQLYVRTRASRSPCNCSCHFTDSHLQMSGLHHALYLLKRYPSSHIPGNEKYNFQGRASQILERWTPLLVNDMSNRRWALSAHHNLIYRNEGMNNYILLEYGRLISGLSDARLKSEDFDDIYGF